MSSNKDHRKKWLILTGSSIIVMAIAAGFAYGFVHANIYRAGDFELTAKLLHENITLFKFGILSWIVIFVLDIIVSIGLYGDSTSFFMVVAIRYDGAFLKKRAER